MPAAVLQPAIREYKWPQTKAVDLTATSFLTYTTLLKEQRATTAPVQEEERALFQYLKMLL